MLEIRRLQRCIYDLIEVLALCARYICAFFHKYECRLNQILPRGRDWVVCLYDLSKTRGDLIIDAMRTHPLVILGGACR
jgi:MEDS: MEthanogen/methylotroph, DcmR Sensory domain